MLHTCRICLRSDDSIVNDVQEFAEIIRKIAQIEMILSDEYPRKVCKDCTTDLLNAELLREMLLECNDLVKEKTGTDDSLSERLYNNDEELVCEDVEEDYDSLVDISDCIKAESYWPKKKKKREEVKVVLRDSQKRIQRQPPVLKVRDLASRVPVKEVDAGCLKKESFYECHYCNKPENNLEAHMKETHPEEPLIFRCRFCENTYQKFSSMKDHVYKAHKLKRNIKCDECSLSFTLLCRLKEHKIKAHSEERNFVCTICTARFKLKSHVKIHMRVHSGEKRYKCEFCEKAYAHYSDWKTHHLTHTGEWKYLCEVCNKGFYKPSALKLHLKTHLL